MLLHFLSHLTSSIHAILTSLIKATFCPLGASSGTQCRKHLFSFFCSHRHRDLGPISGSFFNPTTPCNSIVGDTNQDITGPCWDPYWVVSVLSPILFIVLIVKSTLLIIKEELFRKFFIIHILAVIVSSN